MANATNFSTPSVTVTNYSQSSLDETNYGIPNVSSDSLLLQDGSSYLLLQNSGYLLLGDGEGKPTNYSTPANS